MDEKVMALAALKAATDAADWAFWSMIGTWFAGIATFLAVCVSLHLGLRKPKAHINCKTSMSVFFNGPYKKKGVSIVITNLSLYTVKITSVVWEFKKSVTFYQPFYSQYSMKLPQKLEYGEQASLWIDLEGDTNWIEEIAKGLKEQGAKPKNFRCVVSTTTGESFTFKVSNSLLEQIESSFHQVS
ncbi:hypothetical protein ABGT23_02210 [Enterobacter cloacae]|uniref:hypothetical protein n=1 Tax=Enterobacter cloacae TaxID=550 RepID=UPI00345D9135